MAQMQTLKVDFSDIPDAPPVQRKTLRVDFSDIPDAVSQPQPEQTPQLSLNPLSGKKILRVDFSDIPDAPPVQRRTLFVDFSDIPDAESPAVTSADQSPTDHPGAQSEEPSLKGPTLLPHSLAPLAIKELRDEHKNFLQKVGVLPPTISGEREAVLRAPTQAEDISMTARQRGESTIGAAPVQQYVLEAYESLRKRILPELAPWEIEPTEIYDYFSTPTAPARSKEDWYARVLPSSLVKTAGAISGITTAYAIGARMAETGLEHATGNLSLAETTMEDLKAVGGIVPGMVKGAVKGVPGLNKDWQREWAADPVGTAAGLLGLLGIGKGVNEGAAYLSGKANVTEFLTKEGIPAEQVADTFKAIEKVQGLTQRLSALAQGNRSGVVEGSGAGELGAVENPTETSVNQQVEKADPASKQPSSPYAQLEMALEAAGEPRPPGHAVHHIVALNDRRAALARHILQEFDIPINSADNGVWLPGTRDVGSGVYHRELNTREYHAEVYCRLKNAIDKEEILGVLRDIKIELSENKFPY